MLGEARGYTRLVMDLAGFSRTTKTTEVVGPPKEEITKRAGMIFAMNAPKAAFGIVDVLNNPLATGACNALYATREVLDRTGLVKKEQLEVTANTGGIFILPLKTEILSFQIIPFSQEQGRKMPLFYCHSHIFPTGDRRCLATPNRQFDHQQ